MKNKLLLKKDEWIKKIVSDPKESPSVSLITGFIGDSSEEGHVRVYFNLELSQFLDIKEEDILHSVELSSDESSFGGSKLWIKKSSEVLSGDPSKERIKAKFFEGNIYNAYNDSLRGGTDHHCTMYPYCNEPTPRGATDHFCSKYPYCITPNDTKRHDKFVSDVICTDSCTISCTIVCETKIGCGGSKYCDETKFPGCPHTDPHITNICDTNAISCPSDYGNCNNTQQCKTGPVYNRQQPQRDNWTNVACATDSYNVCSPTDRCNTGTVACPDPGTITKSCTQECYPNTYHRHTINTPTYYCNRASEQRDFWTEVVCTDSCTRTCTDSSASCRTYVECSSKYCTDAHTCRTEYPNCPLDPHITNICNTNAIACPKRY